MTKTLLLISLYALGSGLAVVGVCGVICSSERLLVPAILTPQPPEGALTPQPPEGALTPQPPEGAETCPAEAYSGKGEGATTDPILPLSFDYSDKCPGNARDQLRAQIKREKLTAHLHALIEPENFSLDRSLTPLFEVARKLVRLGEEHVLGETFAKQLEGFPRAGGDSLLVGIPWVAKLLAKQGELAPEPSLIHALVKAIALPDLGASIRGALLDCFFNTVLALHTWCECFRKEALQNPALVEQVSFAAIEVLVGPTGWWDTGMRVATSGVLFLPEFSEVFLQDVADVLKRPGLHDDRYMVAGVTLGTHFCGDLRLPSLAERCEVWVRDCMWSSEVPSAGKQGIVQILGQALKHEANIDRVLRLTSDLSLLPHLMNDTPLCEALVSEVCEPLLFRASHSLPLRLVEEVARVSSRAPGTRYFLGLVADHPEVTHESRIVAREAIQRNRFFPHAKQVRETLGYGQRHALIVHNIGDGQGDELIRTVALVQGLVDLNPELEVVLVTDREYLYDHPQITTAPIRERSRAYARFLNPHYDVIVNHFDKRGRYSDSLQERLLKRVRPDVFLQVHTSKQDATFVIRRCQVGGQEVARVLGLNRERVDSVYDPSLRLLLELGLPVSVPGTVKGHPSVLIARDNAEAQMEWERLRKEAGAHGDTQIRGVALLNPFGGEYPSKGFRKGARGEDFLRLAEYIGELVAAEMSVVIFPNGRQWGSYRSALEIVDLLADDLRPFVTVAPEPKQHPRWPKYFAHYADLIVTVEGGFMHLAHLLGKPYLMLRTAGAGNVQWIPRGGEHQRAGLGGWSVRSYLQQSR